ncbi:unnamed protein product [Ilex paraguariensis]|uniref:Uncharacterized protein n=1 Tax=Ilex paraguariensis TaxID=185542 RepID=A0ABC8SNC9_9AQUA
MVSEKKLANAVGGKTARACDSCIRKRARWYCAADDAFLCQTCDASVHSANSLARRHERVRLKTASIKPSEEAPIENSSSPSWHRGFTRKARTPRHGSRKPKTEELIRYPLHLVPELGSDENSHEESDEQLIYRVPIFDPFVAELCTSANQNEVGTRVNNDSEAKGVVGDESKAMLHDCGPHDLNGFNGFLPSEMELAEFAADVESLLGKGLEDESFDMKGLGLSDCREKDSMEGSSSGKVKVEDEEEAEVAMANQVDLEIDMAREPFELNFDFNSPATYEEFDDKVGAEGTTVKNDEDCEVGDMTKKKILLRLDYEGVITAWADQRSPWTTGERPELDHIGYWPEFMGACGAFHHPYGDVGIMSGHNTTADRGREARVLRYREKRRTRLFSKKIRYEVRKLNAEKRPRMKGRFVKSSSFAGPRFPLLGK